MSATNSIRLLWSHIEALRLYPIVPFDNRFVCTFQPIDAEAEVTSYSFPIRTTFKNTTLPNKHANGKPYFIEKDTAYVPDSVLNCCQKVKPPYAGLDTASV